MELAADFTRWDELLEHGGSDPTWADGMGLHLKRNHIINNKRKIEESLPPTQYPEIYYRATPPEMPMNYMARPDEIRERANATLKVYLQDEDYRFLLTWKGRLDKKQEKDIPLSAVLGYVRGLTTAIGQDDLVTMRRHRRPDHYLDSFRSCAEKIRALPPIENEQMSLGMGQAVY